MKLFRVKTLMSILLCLCLSACGNKGDLYMPEKNQEQESSKQNS